MSTPTPKEPRTTRYKKHVYPEGNPEFHLQCVECHAFDKAHRSGCSSLRAFPIQGGGNIPWWLAEVAYEFYHDNWKGQSLERLAERGGFGVTELICFLRRNENYEWQKEMPR